MTLKTLNKDVQNLISASIKIVNYRTAIEELVYNALDGDSTSIAVRINIEENTIQLIDNGCGISSIDFTLLGQKYSTSKCADLLTLKAVPNKYGYRGQFLSALIQVSQKLIVTSRSQDSKETWCKVFEEGKEKALLKTVSRPSKGTTVEIKGFLYNLKIRKRSIDPLQEIREIKTFLEQLSLVHSNVSISLRDDSENNIIFKLHKHRDIYQTLSTLFNIDKADLQELTVEKSQYKTVAYISKIDKETNDKHWIYVNGRLTQSTRLHKMINDKFKKTLQFKYQTKRKIKTRTAFNEEEKVSSGDRLPFYVIFITCPYLDYDISHTPKHSILEFKNWENINRLLEKLIKFYFGDVNFKPEKGQDYAKTLIQPRPTEDDTRDQVRKIVEKMLGSTIRRPGVSQMQNGIKGKLTKRKSKKLKDTQNDVPVSKVTPAKTIPSAHIQIDTQAKAGDNVANETGFLETHKKVNDLPKKKCQRKQAPRKKIQGKLKIQNVSTRIEKEPVRKISKCKIKNIKEIAKQILTKSKSVDSIKLLKKQNIQKLQQKSKSTTNVTKTGSSIKMSIEDESDIVPKNYVIENPLLVKFEKPTDTIKKKCEQLQKNVDDLLKHKKSVTEIIIEETPQSKNIMQNHKNLVDQQNIDEIVVNKSIATSRPLSCSSCTFDNRDWTVIQKNMFKTNYDLLHTILTVQTKENRLARVQEANENSSYYTTKCLDYSKYFEEPQYRYDANPELNINNFNKLKLMPKPIIPDSTFLEPTLVSSHCETKRKLTYESHQYGSFEKNQPGVTEKPYEKQNIIRLQSKNNFRRDRSQVNKNFKIGFQKLFHNKCKPYMVRETFSKIFNNTKTWMQNIDETEYTIEFSNSKSWSQLNHKYVYNSQYQDRKLQDINKSPAKQQETYTIVEPSENENDQNNICYINNSSTSHQINISYQSHRSAKQCRPSDSDCKDPLPTYVVRNEDGNIFEQNNNIINESVAIVDENGKEITKDLDDNNINVMYASSHNIVQQSMQPFKVCDTLQSEEEKRFVDQLDPLNVCETIHSQEIDDCVDIVPTFNDSFFNEGFDSIFLDRNIYITTSNFEAFDHEFHDHFANGAKDYFDKKYTENNLYTEKTNERNNEIVDEAIKVNGTTKSPNDFNIKIRPRFIPKGLSPIFEKCRTRNPFAYESEKEYYEDSIYNNFANKVQANTEVFEPKIQDLKERTTKDIEKVNSRLNKENATLIFDAESLKNTLVLNQVDNKFISAKIKIKPDHKSRTAKEYLVMFDQHAVHERIRLEKNLSDYFDGQEWKSIGVDEITIKLSQDDILFLHNYRDKFMQFGLQWTISDGCEVCITAIPEAVLGKNPRQVDVVIKAIKNLITEEIAAIKNQKGCIFLYPKSIMDLVFSEACRYAIKFGDRLSRKECQELIKSLSECKTPFQCAHGRPVMAVLMEAKNETMEYKVNVSKIRQFCKKMY